MSLSSKETGELLSAALRVENTSLLPSNARPIRFALCRGAINGFVPREIEGEEL